MATGPARREQGGSVALLAPYRVIDLTDDRGHLAGLILAQLGADVIAVEPPGGSRARPIGPFEGDEPGPERSFAALVVQPGQAIGGARPRRLRRRPSLPSSGSSPAPTSSSTTPSPGLLESWGLGGGAPRRRSTRRWCTCRSPPSARPARRPATPPTTWCSWRPAATCRSPATTTGRRCASRCPRPGTTPPPTPPGRR